MHDQQIEPEWNKPKSERPLDELDREVLALAKVHRDAVREGVKASTFVFRLLRQDYLEAQKINRSLSPEERSKACEGLQNRNPRMSVLDILKNVIAQRP